MRTRLEIEVTAADCAEGVRGNAHFCVVHTAIGRTCPEATHLTVDAQTIRFSIEEEGVRRRFVYLTPHAVRDYIIAFDAGDAPKPMRFTLDKPQVTEIPARKMGEARIRSFRASAQGTGESRSRRVFGERSYRVNKQTT